MASPTSGISRSTSLRDDDSHTAKLEGTGSWDAIEWTKIEPIIRPVSRGNLDFLLEAEHVRVQAKEVAERKAKEIANAMESLKVEQRNEKQLRISVLNIAKRKNKENVAMKREIQSIGRKVSFSSSDDSIVDIEICPAEVARNLKYSVTGKEFVDKKDLSASVTITEDDKDANNAISPVCETLYPFRTQDGHYRWPNAACAQRGSQFVGLKANFDALDQLLIDDDYFQPE